MTQTFTNFEVIIVNDCSTDNSVAIVESYASKFNGRLTLSHTETNSGSPGIPRNKGLILSRGEYVYFMDADDMLTKTALEELYALAKKFDADLAHFTGVYTATADGTITETSFNRNYNSTDKLLLDENLPMRLKGILEGKFWYAPWRYFIKRTLPIEHELFFPKLTTAEDQIFMRAMILCAKKFLIVPRALYIYRKSENSTTRTERTFEQKAKVCLEPTTIGLSWLKNVLRKIEFFKANPQYAQHILEQFAWLRISDFLRQCNDRSFADVYKALQYVFGEKLGEHDVLICALCTVLNTQQKINAANIQQFNQFVAHAQEQVDQFAAAANKRIAELESEVKRLQS